MNGNLAYKLEPQEEVINGKVVMMATPTSNHNRITVNLSNIFGAFLRGKPCEYFSDREALYLEEDMEEYQPDGMVVCDPEKVRDKGVYGTPDLVIEVLSPSTGRYDKGHKKDIYEKHGVREYWIIGPGDRFVEQYVLEDGRFVLRGAYSLYPDFLLEGMKEEERAELVTEFQCGLFKDLTVRLEDVFYRVTPGV
ncbi:MAG: Uma2 family endonuclease [Oscillibacter sp.]|nr:Uma2 family endonuclease [Oscillibacter sp.]